MILLKPLLFKQLTTTIIGPHGITDMIHANQTNHLAQLYQINALTATSSIVLSQIHMTPILDTVFFIASIIHFRRDMPEISNIPRYVWSTALLMTTIQIPELFFAYMVLVHVPHHYEMNWKYMKENPRMSFALILVTTLLMGHTGTMLGDNIYADSIVNVSKGIIVSHIVYEELFVHKNATHNSSYIES
jgi:hypothetical protein